MSDTMYPMKPVFNLDVKVDLPTCVYQMPIIQVSKSVGGDKLELSEDEAKALKSLATRQENILNKLEQLRAQVESYRSSMGLTNTPAPTKVGPVGDIVVRCSPSHPPYSLPGLINILAKQVKVHASCHVHSSVTNLPHQLTNFIHNNCNMSNSNITENRSEAQVKITLIWKDVGRECEVMVSPLVQTQIKGEVNLVRYLARQFPTILPYETKDNCSAVDNLLDCVTTLLWAQPKDRQPILRPLAINLGKSPFLAGDSLCLADLALYSVIKQLGLDKDLQPEFKRWFALVAVKLGGGRSHRASSRQSGTFYHRSSRNSRRFSEKEKTPPSNNNNNKKQGNNNGGGKGNNNNNQKGDNNGGKGNNNQRGGGGNYKKRRDSHKEKTPPAHEKSPKKSVTVRE